jgi:hypothetical protein
LRRRRLGRVSIRLFFIILFLAGIDRNQQNHGLLVTFVVLLGTNRKSLMSCFKGDLLCYATDLEKKFEKRKGFT